MFILSRWKACLQVCTIAYCNIPFSSIMSVLDTVTVLGIHPKAVALTRSHNSQTRHCSLASSSATPSDCSITSTVLRTPTHSSLRPREGHGDPRRCRSVSHEKEGRRRYAFWHPRLGFSPRFHVAPLTSFLWREFSCWNHINVATFSRFVEFPHNFHFPDILRFLKP
jgi:hypothetical protein